jgi:hypothetical protein
MILQRRWRVRGQADRARARPRRTLLETVRYQHPRCRDIAAARHPQNEPGLAQEPGLMEPLQGAPAVRSELMPPPEHQIAQVCVPLSSGPRATSWA